MSQGGSGSPDDAAMAKNRYQLLRDITDSVTRAKSLTAAFQEFARPVLSLTGCDLLNLSLHDPSRDCMLTHYWKRNQESGQFDAFPVDGAVTGWAWKHQEAIEIPDTAREQRFPVRAHFAHSRSPILHRSSIEHAFSSFWSDRLG
jgi:hypothetical protein